MSEGAELLNLETNIIQECNNSNFTMKQDIHLMEGIKTQSSIWQTQDNYDVGNKILIKNESDCDFRSESGLSEMSDRKLKFDKLGRSNINLSTICNAGKSVINVPHTKLQICRLSLSENRLSHNYESFCNLSSHHTSLSLPAIPISCSDEEETLFNQLHNIKQLLFDMQSSMNKEIFGEMCKNNKIEYEHDINQCKKQVEKTNVSEMRQTCKKIIASEQSNNNKIVHEKVQNMNDTYKDSESKSTITLNSNMRNNLISQSIFFNDNKLGKMSLLTNPISIMQSNVQLLNKSRNFLNYITEKSTNIMEKALLPQHLSMRYNHVSKSTENDITKTFCTNKISSSIDIPNSGTNLKHNPDDVANVTNCIAKQTTETSEKTLDKLDNVINNKNEYISPSISKKGEQYYDLKEKKERLLHNNDIEDKMLLSEKEHIIEKNDTDQLNLDTIDGRIKQDILLTEMNVKCEKQIIPQTEELNNDTCKKDSSDIYTLIHANIPNDLLQHPLYSTLLEDYTYLKSKNLKLLERIEYLEKSKHSNGKTQINTDVFISQIDNLEKTINKLTAELNSSLITQETLKKECTAVNKERENMIMKYVISEKQLIDSQRTKDSTERKIKELIKDQESLQNKLCQTQGERIRICNTLDGKCREITDFRKEIDKLKEDIKFKEIKLKWTQNKLQTEMDSQRDTQQKLDKALMKINDMKEECEQIRRETQESFRQFQQSEENKAVTLDQQLKEHQARLILERHVTEDKETLRLQLQKEMEMLKSRQKDLIEENKRLNLELQKSEKSRLNYQENFNDLKIVANQRQAQIIELLNKVSHLETLTLQLQHKEEHIASTEVQIQQLRLVNEDLQSDIQACRQKEADMLDFTQKLTDKNVLLQSKCNAIQTKVNNLESEHGPLREYISELTNKIKVLEGDLIQEQRKRREECEILATHLAEQTQLAQNFSQKLEDSQGENMVLKRKHQISIKELTRELQQCRRKLEMFETASPSNSLDVTSRSDSNTSLNTAETVNDALSDNNPTITINDDNAQSVEPSRQVLMDRIIKLQNINVRRAEKLDFLEGHTQTLVEELQKKTKIIHNYILHQDYGALGCNERDKNKAELARYGGIMASFYNNRVSDENMTLELSLEINRKLQAVLEDALLKNITLKDNIDTLGNEIARLTMQHQQKQIEN